MLYGGSAAHLPVAADGVTTANRILMHSLMYAARKNSASGLAEDTHLDCAVLGASALGASTAQGVIRLQLHSARDLAVGG